MARLSDADRRLFDRVNHRLQAFKNEGITNNLLDIAVNELQNIYLDASAEGVDIHNVNMNKFTFNGNIAEGERLEELRNLAKAIDEQKTSKVSYYKKHDEIPDYIEKSYEVIKRKKGYKVDSFQDFVDFVDDVKQAKDIMRQKKGLDSKQITKLFRLGKSKRISREEVIKWIEKKYDDFNNGDDLYVYMRRKINDEAKKREV